MAKSSDDNSEETETNGDTVLGEEPRSSQDALHLYVAR